MTTAEQDKKAKNMKRLVTYTLAFIGCVLIAPFTLLAVEGAVGVITFLGVIGGTLFLAPLIGRKAANWRLKAIKAEAARNPIETLQNDQRVQIQKVEAYKDKLEQFGAQKMNFASKLGKFRKTYSVQECEMFDKQLVKMEQLYQIRLHDLTVAEKGLQQYELEIQKAKAIWDMGQAADAMNKAAGMTDEDFFDKVSKETALDAVQLSLNKSFAAMDVSFAEESSRPDEAAMQATRKLDTTT